MERVQGRAWRGASGNSPEVPNICGTNGNCGNNYNFENENFGLFVGGAYSKAFTDRLYGTARLALVLDGEADVSENFRCAGGIAPNIGDTGTLFEGEATSIGLSLYYSSIKGRALTLLLTARISAMMMARIIGQAAKRAPKNHWR